MVTLTSLVAACWAAAALVSAPAAMGMLVALGTTAGIAGLLVHEVQTSQRRGYELRRVGSAASAGRIQPPERLPLAC